MKKIILSLATLLAFGFANAQDAKSSSGNTGRAKTTADFGIKGGFNFANVTNSDGGSTLVSFHVGAFVEIPVASRFYIQPEVLYSGQGVKFDDFSFHLNYINIPVMAKYYVTDEFALELGPQLGILTTAEVTDGDNSADIKGLFNTTDVGLNLGASYDVSDRMFIGARYNLGLTKLIKDESLEPGESNSQNSVFQLSLGFKF